MKKTSSSYTSAHLCLCICLCLKMLEMEKKPDHRIHRCIFVLKCLRWKKTWSSYTSAHPPESLDTSSPRVINYPESDLQWFSQQEKTKGSKKTRKLWNCLSLSWECVWKMIVPALCESFQTPPANTRLQIKILMSRSRLQNCHRLFSSKKLFCFPSSLLSRYCSTLKCFW